MLCMAPQDEVRVLLLPARGSKLPGEGLLRRVAPRNDANRREAVRRMVARDKDRFFSEAEAAERR